MIEMLIAFGKAIGHMAANMVMYSRKGELEVVKYLLGSIAREANDALAYIKEQEDGE